MLIVGKVSALLLCLAAGYGTLVLSNKQERPLDVLGRLIGAVILLVSFVGLLCTAVCSWKCRYGDSMSACHGPRKMMCPFSKSSPDASETTAETAPAPQ